MKLGFVTTVASGGLRVRALWPARELQKLGFDVGWCQKTFPTPGECDVLIVHRPLGNTANLHAIQEQRAAGTRVIAQEDDDLHDLPDRFMNGLLDDIDDLIKAHDTACFVADTLIVSTEPLAAVYSNPRGAQIVRNYLPTDFAPKRFQRNGNDPVRVGWTGWLGTHEHDIRWIAPARDELLDGAIFTSVGDLRTAPFLCENTARAERFPATDDQTEYYHLQSRADVGIVPLAPTVRLNTGKSWLKALEYMALGIPVVATNLPEQARLITHGVNGFLADTPEEFAGYVQKLVRDEERRRTMSVLAQQRANELWIDQHIQEWVEAIEIAAAIPA